jgi:hypothetical protein
MERERMKVKDYVIAWMILLAISTIIFVSAIILEILMGYHDWIFSFINIAIAILLSTLIMPLIALVVLIIIDVIDYIRRR